LPGRFDGGSQFPVGGIESFLVRFARNQVETGLESSSCPRHETGFPQHYNDREIVGAFLVDRAASEVQ
jgi:hypothetical protein